MDYYYRASLPEDIPSVAPRIRPMDHIEVEAISGLDMHTCLTKSLALGECFSVVVGEQVEAMFGCASKGDIGIPWFLTTDNAFHDTRHFMQQCAEKIAEWQDKHQLLFNYVHADNKKAIRWLKKLGFVFLERHVFNGHPFITFVRIKKDV